jgi:cytochrome c oxidase subunit 2
MRIVILGICALLTALVFATMLVVIWKSRRSGDVGARFHRSAAVEVVWAVIPCVMFVACAVPAVRLIVASAATVNQTNPEVRERQQDARVQAHS